MKKLCCILLVIGLFVLLLSGCADAVTPDGERDTTSATESAVDKVATTVSTTMVATTTTATSISNSVTKQPTVAEVSPEETNLFVKALLGSWSYESIYVSQSCPSPSGQSGKTYHELTINTLKFDEEGRFFCRRNVYFPFSSDSNETGKYPFTRHGIVWIGTATEPQYEEEYQYAVKDRTVTVWCEADGADKPFAVFEIECVEDGKLHIGAVQSKDKVFDGSIYERAE